jgi:hypothetical protein
VAPPTFVFFTNVATTFHFSYQRYLENRLREEFGFDGTPLRIHVRALRRRRKAAAGCSTNSPPTTRPLPQVNRQKNGPPLT